MGRVLEIAELGNPVLRERAEEVENLKDEELEELRQIINKNRK